MPYQIPILATKPYRPSNGTEGMMFFNAFCDRCRHETEESPCPLIGLTMVHEVGDPLYPSQYWTHTVEGEPVCLAFSALPGVVA